MDDAFVFYAYWNGNQIRDLFEGLVSVTNGSGFVQLAAFLVAQRAVPCWPSPTVRDLMLSRV